MGPRTVFSPGQTSFSFHQSLFFMPCIFYTYTQHHFQVSWLTAHGPRPGALDSWLTAHGPRLRFSTGQNSLFLATLRLFMTCIVYTYTQDHFQVSWLTAHGPRPGALDSWLTAHGPRLRFSTGQNSLFLATLRLFMTCIVYTYTQDHFQVFWLTAQGPRPGALDSWLTAHGPRLRFSTGQNSLFLATLCLFLDLYFLYIHSRSFLSLVAHGSRPAARGS